MAEDLQQLIKEHDAFYEVLSYYVVLDNPHGTPAATRRRIHAGFDVDIYGTTTSHELPPPDYAVGYAGLQKTASTVAEHAEDRCSIGVVPFPSTVYLDTRNHLQARAKLRIRISHGRGLDQPAGAPEERALREIENELKSLGVPRR
jgi:hypothetical protein